MKNREVVQRALWTRLRLALLWVRKSGVLKLRVVQKLKCLGHTTKPTKIHYYERQLSFDKTPLFNVNMYRPPSFCFSIPCIKPKADFDQDDEYDYGRKSSVIDAGHEDEEYYYGYEEEEEEEDIDKRAEEFIVKFYQQMKLQRQNLQYSETPNRDSC